MTQPDEQSVDAARAHLAPPSPVSPALVPSAGVVARDGEVGVTQAGGPQGLMAFSSPPCCGGCPQAGWSPAGIKVNMRAGCSHWDGGSSSSGLGAGSPPQDRTISHRPPACAAARCFPSSLQPVPCSSIPAAGPPPPRPLPKSTRAHTTATRHLRSIILHPNHQTPIPTEVRKQSKSFPPSVTQDRESSVTWNARTTADLFPPHKSG